MKDIIILNEVNTKNIIEAADKILNEVYFEGIEKEEIVENINIARNNDEINNYLILYNLKLGEVDGVTFVGYAFYEDALVKKFISNPNTITEEELNQF